MKHFILSVVIATGFGGVACAQTCVWPSEKTAFEITGLKNSLMVAALSCQADDSYNQFVQKYQAALLTQQGVMDRYFARAGGLAGRQQEDVFMTRLANEQSSASLSQGAAYCAAAANEFREVMGLPNVETLTAFAAGQGGPDVAAMEVCAGSEPSGISGAPRMVIAARKKAPDGDLMADAGKPATRVAAGPAHEKRKAVAKAPAKPVTGLVQV